MHRNYLSSMDKILRETSSGQTIGPCSNIRWEETHFGKIKSYQTLLLEGVPRNMTIDEQF